MTHKLPMQSFLILAGLISSVVPSGMLSQRLSEPGNSLTAGNPSPEVTHDVDPMTTSSGRVQDELKLARDYFAGRGVTRDVSQAVYWYRKAAEQGDPGAQVDLGYFYLAGIGVKPDAAQAVRWFQRASASGSRMGKLNLAVVYLRGEGVPRDMHVGLELLNELAKQDDPRAEAYLGLVYMLGTGVKQDPAAAEHWFEKAAKHHSPEGEYAMGSLYSVTDGHKHDLERAVSYLRQSSDAGYVPSKHSLGLILVKHPELPQGAGEAAALLEAAATGGSWRSSVVLGILYRDGRGVPKDISVAYHWFTIAEKQGGEQTEAYLRNDLQSARAALSAEEQKRVELSAVQWAATHTHTDVFVLNGDPGSAFFPMAEVYSTELAQVDSSKGASIR
jgi:TPR repeat protein